jgi:hypothetical protein
MQDGLPSLLRRARLRKSRGRVSPLFLCVLLAGVLVPASVGWSAPSPDPPPPEVDGAGGTALQPDVRPTQPRSIPAAPSRPVETPVAPRSAEAPAESPPADAPVASRSAEATVDQPVTAPPSPPAAPRAAPSRTRPARARPKPVRESTPRSRPAARPFASAQKPTRRPPRARAAPVRPRGALTLVSSDPDSGPYLAAALSLAVLVFGSATLLTVSARLRPPRRRLT